MGNVITGACFCLFGKVYMALGANLTSHFLAQVFLETGIWSESLELLTGFLANLEQKLWLKKQFLTKIKTLHERYDLPSQGKFWPAITQQTELESYSNRLKTRKVL